MSAQGHKLAKKQIAKHGRDRYPTAPLQALKACAELGELADLICKAESGRAILPSRFREEYADAGLALFELGNKLGIDLMACMRELVDADERKFG